MEVEAYFEEWSRLPGDRVRMAISTPHPQVRATLERITHGPSMDSGQDHQFGRQVPGLDEVVPGIRQRTATGSHGQLPLAGRQSADCGIHLWFWPTVPERADERQVIWSVAADGAHRRIGLAVEGGQLVLVEDDDKHELGIPIDARIWYSVVVDFGAIGEAVVDVAQVSGLPSRPPRSIRTVHLRALPDFDRILLAAGDVDEIGGAVDGFNGKIESPSLFSLRLTEDERGRLHDDEADTPDSSHRWNFSGNMASEVIREVLADAPAGSLRNGGERAVTGHNWTGMVDAFSEHPEQYGAIQFHSDDMIDSNWEYNLEFDLPEDLRSGVYAVRLQVDGHEDRYPLFVRAPAARPADVLLLFPTNTYLAYGNDRFAASDLTPVMGHEKRISADERYLNEHPELGSSCYDVHSDGTPVRYSSRRRPLVNVRPHYPNFLTGTFRHFAVDLFLLEWLERSGYTYDVATDEDLHLEGEALLSRYKVVVTGSHPEYWSGNSLTSLRSYLSAGGKMMYLGGNGFYWVTTHDPAKPWIVEVRRDNAGLRAWDAPAGERNHAHTSEPGGLWRYRGRGPNTICGVSFATEGWSQGRGYVRTPASKEYPVSRFFEGISEEVIGDFGHVLGGAAGDECDRHDLILGSPPQAVVIASASGFGPEYLIVNEDMRIPMPNQDGPNRPDMVRSDMVYLPVHDGGAVFSAGSIAFAGAIAWNDFDNNVRKLVDNVLAFFIQDNAGSGGSQ